MYGKHFSSMYERSMIGSGAIVFAVMGYVIANQVPDKLIGSQVSLNPTLLGMILGEKEEDVVKAIEFLCSPDPRSTTKGEGGRRLVRIGEFDYRVVNGAKYRAIRDEDQRREQNRAAQNKFRAKQRAAKSGKPLPGEKEHQRLMEAGASEEALAGHVDGVNQERLTHE